MIFGPALADVMQQQGHIDDPTIDPVFQNATDHGQFFHQLAPFDLRKARDALDDMLVHRVVVVDVELHHGDDVFKLGDKGRQHPQFVHPPQWAFGVAVIQEQAQEYLHRCGIIAQVIVDQVQVRRQKPHHIGVQQIASPQRLFKDAQNVERV